MISRIKRFFDSHLAAPATPAGGHPSRSLQLAVAALLIEVTAVDHQQLPEEQAAIMAAVRRHFDLDKAEARELIELAEAEHLDATDYFQFTHLINRHYSPRQKVQLIELLWQIAYSDNSLDSIEEHVIRRLAELIHVPHSDFIATKHRARRGIESAGD